ncbi:MAG: phage portal protein [Chloroflexi bacterium]|nr:phage portal protein [Chloroflexota bacterium]
MASNPFSSDAYLMPPVNLTDYQMSNQAGARWSRYQQYLSFYRGWQWSELRRPGERRLTVNYARAIVQKHASYFIGKPVQFELISNNHADLSLKATEQALREMWDDNGLAVVDYDAAVDAAVLGDGGFKVTLQPNDEADPLEPVRHAGRPRQTGTGAGGRVVVRAVDITRLNAGFKYADLKQLTWVTEQYQLTAGEAREQYGSDLFEAAGLTMNALADSENVEMLERWTESQYSVEVNRTAIIAGPNPYGFIPYVLFPNRAVPRCAWGESDLEDILPLASEFNVRVSVLSQLLQMSGNPVLVLENVEDSEGLRVGPGAIWHLPEGAKAQLLEMLSSGGVDLHIKYIETLYQMLHDLSEAPASGFGRGGQSSGRSGGGGGGGGSSGVALEIMLHPVIQRVSRKRRIWDEVLDRRNRMMLRLSGLPVYRSRIIWPDVLPRDRAALVTQEVGLVASSIHSLATARRVLGDEQPELENDLIVAEREKLGLNAVGGGSGGAAGRIAPIGASAKDQQPVKLSGALVQGLSNSGG